MGWIRCCDARARLIHCLHMIHCKSETQVYCFAFRTFFLGLMPPKCGSVAKVRHKTQRHILGFRQADLPYFLL